MNERDNIEIVEEAILGMMISNTDNIMNITEKLTPEDFTKKINGDVFQIMCYLYTQYTTVDAIQLEEELEKNGKLLAFGGREKISQIVEDAPLSTALEAYVDMLSDKSTKLKLKDACTDIVREIDRNYKNGKELLDLAQLKIFSVKSDKKAEPIVSIKALGDERRKKIIALSELGDKTALGIPTNFFKYDTMTGGLHGSDLIILAARPAVGKSAFAINLACNVAKQKKTVLFFSLEMTGEQIYDRILSISSELSLKNIRENKLSQEDLFKCNKVEEEISEYPLFISDNSFVTILDIRNYARKFKTEHNLDFIIIDYLQLITSPSQNKQREQQVSEISRSLKLLAKELNVPILALSQLSRSVENRTDKRPMLSDLRESGAIEQDADQVMFLHREDYYGKPNKEDTENKESEKKEFSKLQKIEVIIGKHRNGSTGTIELSYNLSNQRFGNDIYIQGGMN